MQEEVEAQNAKEIGKAVAIAALSAIAIDLLKWGMDECKAEMARRRELKKPVVKAEEEKANE